MSSFADLINYKKLFAGLKRETNVNLSQTDEEDLQALIHDELKGRTNPGIGKNLGASLTNWVYSLFAFVQNIFKGFRTDDIGGSFTAAADNTGTKLDAHMRDEAMQHIYMRLREDGRFKGIADWVTGVSWSSEQPHDMQESLFRQIEEKAGVPGNLNSSLNKSRARAQAAS